MVGKLKSKELIEHLELVLAKNSEEIEEADLVSIEGISLKHKDFNGEVTDYTTEDLKSLTNLTNCSLYAFDVTEKEIEELNILPKLKHLHFDFCNLNVEEIKLNKNIKTVIFNECNVNIRQLRKVESNNIIIICDIALDIDEFENMSELNTLSIHNATVKNIGKILEKAPNLELLNLDGSKIDTESEIEELKKKIKVTHAEFYRLANA